MRVFKRGKYFHYEFEFEQRRYRGSTHRKNEREAIQMAAGIQFNTMKKAVGLASTAAAPTIREFQAKFNSWVEQELEDKGTQEFYKSCYCRLVACSFLSDTRLNEIDEPKVEKFKTWALSLDAVKTKTTVNRYLATLSKALHYAADKLKLIERVPKIHKFPKSKTCERERDFTFTDDQYANWTAAAPEPLRTASILARGAGLSLNEMMALQKDCIHFEDKPDARGIHGVIEIRRGLKRESRRRNLPITAAMRKVLVTAMKQSRCKYVLASTVSPAKPMSKNTIEDQIRQTRIKVGLPTDAGLHTLRHTFLTRAGELTQNVKALQKLAGHSNVTTTMRYIHPEEADVFGIVASMNSKEGKPPSKAKASLKKAAGSD